MKSELAWHFLADRNGSPVYRDGSPASVEQTLRHEGRLELCHSGLHYSRKPIDALGYAPGPWICRDQIDGERKYHKDKGVCRERTILWMFDGTALLRAFARKWAADLLHLWNAPKIVVQYLATEDESIRIIARAETWARIWSYETWARIWSTERNGAWAATGSSPAWKLAWNVAWSISGGSMWTARWRIQNNALEAALAQIDPFRTPPKVSHGPGCPRDPNGCPECRGIGKP